MKIPSTTRRPYWFYLKIFSSSAHYTPRALLAIIQHLFPNITDIAPPPQHTIYRPTAQVVGAPAASASHSITINPFFFLSYRPPRRCCRVQDVAHSQTTRAHTQARAEILNNKHRFLHPDFFKSTLDEEAELFWAERHIGKPARTL